MRRFVKIVIIIYLIYMVIFPMIDNFFSNSQEISTGFNDYARITDVDYKAVVLDDVSNGGDVLITERLTFDIHASSKDNLFWELWRDLPEDYVDGLKVDYDVNYVKQIVDDREIVYEESPKLYWDDSDYTSLVYGPHKWYHSEGPYDEYARDYECVFFYIDGTYRDELVFEIQYVMHNASLKYSDVSELYLTMYSEDSIKYLDSFKGEILIANKDMPKEGNYIAYTFGTNNDTFEFVESDTKNPGYHTFSFDLDKSDLKFRKYNQFLEFTLLTFNEDRHIFTDYAPSNVYSSDVYLDEAKNAIDEYDELIINARVKKIIIFVGCILISLLFIMFVIYRNKKIKKNNIFYTPFMNVDYFREIPSDLDPYFAASLAFIKHNNKVDIGDAYSALLLSLVRKKYIELDLIDKNKDWKFNNINIKILYVPSLNTMKTTTNSDLSKVVTVSDYLNNNLEKEDKYNIYNVKLEQLSDNEESYFNLITKYAIGNSITLKAFQDKISTDYVNTNSFVSSVNSSIVNIGISNGYFQKASYNKLKSMTNVLANGYIIIALIIMIFGNINLLQTRIGFAYGALFILGIVLIGCAIYLKRKANDYILFSQKGIDEYVKWHGLYEFLNSQTLMYDKEVVDIKLWEKYLVYATAFGISNKVIKALEVRGLDVTSSPILSNPYYRSADFRYTTHHFRSSYNRATSTYRASSFGSSHYGGAGRGGGGGGGGH